MPVYINTQPPADGERRHTPRYLVPPGSLLVVGVVVRDAEGKAKTFTGRARDVSLTGLAIVLPPDEGCGELVSNSRSLVAVVSLPAGVIRLTATPVYCHPPDEGQTERGYVVGVSITEINEHDLSLLAEYLGGLV